MHAQAHIKHGLYITKTENSKWGNRRRDAMTLWKAITKLAGSQDIVCCLKSLKIIHTELSWSRRKARRYRAAVSDSE